MRTWRVEVASLVALTVTHCSSPNFAFAQPAGSIIQARVMVTDSIKQEIETAFRRWESGRDGLMPTPSRFCVSDAHLLGGSKGPLVMVFSLQKNGSSCHQKPTIQFEPDCGPVSPESQQQIDQSGSPWMLHVCRDDSGDLSFGLQLSSQRKS